MKLNVLQECNALTRDSANAAAMVKVCTRTRGRKSPSGAECDIKELW